VKKKKSNIFKELFGDVESQVSLSFARTDENGDKTIGLNFLLKNYGFGDFTIRQKKDGAVFVHSERSNPEAVIYAFAVLIKKAIFDWEQDPEKHLLFNKNMNVYGCGCGCGFSRKLRRKARRP